MTPIADMVEQMISGGIPPEFIVLAVRTAEQHAGQSHTSTDFVAERRRAYDRERKRRSGGNPVEQAHKEISPTPPKEKLNPPCLPSGDIPPEGETAPLEAKTDWPSDYRQQFWVRYPKRVGKQAAFRVLDRVRKSGRVPWSAFLASVDRYRESVAATETRFIKNPATWLNAGCWDDEINVPGKPATAVAHIVQPGSAQFDAWRAHYRDAGKQFSVKQFDDAIEWRKPVTVPSEWPPGHQAA